MENAVLFNAQNPLIKKIAKSTFLASTNFTLHLRIVYAILILPRNFSTRSITILYL